MRSGCACRCRSTTTSPTSSVWPGRSTRCAERRAEMATKAAAKGSATPLSRYQAKRNFGITAEPAGKTAATRSRRRRRRRCPSSSRSTGRVGCTTTSASSSTACCCAGRCRRGRASTRRRSRWPSTSRTIRSSYSDVRGHDSAEAVRRRHGDRLGPRHLGAGRRPARGPGEGQAGVQAARREARRPVGAGAHLQARATSRTSGCCSRSATSGRARSREYDVITALPDSVVGSRSGWSKSASRSEGPRSRSGGAVDERSQTSRARRDGAAAGQARPQLATLASPRRRRRRLDRRDQVRRLSHPRAHRRRQGALFTRNGHDWTRSSKALAAASRRSASSRLARRRDRRA